MAKYNVFETKEDWAKFRRGLFTASEVHRLLAEPKLKADKEAGNLSEGAKTYVREAYANSIGKSVNDDDFVYTSVGGFVFFTDEEYNAGGTPDIIIGKSICEIKCPLSKTHLEYLMMRNVEELQKAVPQYYAQMQMNMWLCDAEDGVFISFDDRYYNQVHHLHSIYVPRDEEYIEIMKSKLLKAKEYKNQILNTI